MKLLSSLLFISLSALLIAGCNFPGSQSLPTPLPSEYIPTAIALTVEARKTALAQVNQPPATHSATAEMVSIIQTETTPTAAPTFTPSPEPETSEPDPATLTPSTTATPPPEVPYGIVQILNPGPASRVTSPFLLRAYLLPEDNGRVKVELLGEDGRVLMREIRVYDPPGGVRVTMGMEISYEISAAAEAGWVQVSLVDKDGRTSALASAELILLSIGEPDLNPSGDNFEAIVIQEPRPNALIQGGTLRIAGLARTRSMRPLMIELQTNEGKVVGTRQVAVERTDSGQYGNFAIDVPYNVSAATRVRLVVWEPGEPIPSIVHLSSLEVLLSP